MQSCVFNRNNSGSEYCRYSLAVSSWIQQSIIAFNIRWEKVHMSSYKYCKKETYFSDLKKEFPVCIFDNYINVNTNKTGSVSTYRRNNWAESAHAINRPIKINIRFICHRFIIGNRLQQFYCLCNYKQIRNNSCMGVCNCINQCKICYG